MKIKRNRGHELEAQQKNIDDNVSPQFNINSYHTEKNWWKIEGGIINQFFLSDSKNQKAIKKILVTNLLPFINPSIPEYHRANQAKKAVERIFSLASEVSHQLSESERQKTDRQIYLIEPDARKVAVAQMLFVIIRAESRKSRTAMKGKMNDLKLEKQILDRFLKQLTHIIATHGEHWGKDNALVQSDGGYVPTKDVYFAALSETEKRLHAAIEIINKRIQNGKRDLLPRVNALSFGTLCNLSWITGLAWKENSPSKEKILRMIAEIFFITAIPTISPELKEATNTNSISRYDIPLEADDRIDKIKEALRKALERLSDELV